MQQQGRVKWFNERKGYGFIAQESGEDLFVHFSQVQGKYLKEGEMVEFEIGEGRKGPCAVNVQQIWRSNMEEQQIIVAPPSIDLISLAQLSFSYQLKDLEPFYLIEKDFSINRF